MNNYKIGQQVIHCRDGLAVVVGTTNMADKDYYVVKTIRGSGENIYVPVDVRKRSRSISGIYQNYPNGI